jgi:hypothetical protein
VADLGYINRSEEGDIEAEQNTTSEFVSILISREENMPLGVSRNKSVEGLQCPDSRGYIDEYDIAVILCIGN